MSSLIAQLPSVCEAKIQRRNEIKDVIKSNKSEYRILFKLIHDTVPLHDIINKNLSKTQLLKFYSSDIADIILKLRSIAVNVDNLDMEWCEINHFLSKTRFYKNIQPRKLVNR